MSLVPSRRGLALALAATLFLSLPGLAQALPSSEREEPRSFLQQIFDGPAEWVKSLWEAVGCQLDPNGAPTSQSPSDGDAGSSLDPDGRT